MQEPGPCCHCNTAPLTSSTGACMSAHGCIAFARVGISGHGSVSRSLGSGDPHTTFIVRWSACASPSITPASQAAAGAPEATPTDLSTSLCHYLGRVETARSRIAAARPGPDGPGRVHRTPFDLQSGDPVTRAPFRRSTVHGQARKLAWVKVWTLESCIHATDSRYSPDQCAHLPRQVAYPPLIWWKQIPPWVNPMQEGPIKRSEPRETPESGCAPFGDVAAAEPGAAASSLRLLLESQLFIVARHRHASRAPRCGRRCSYRRPRRSSQRPGRPRGAATARRPG